MSFVQFLPYQECSRQELLLELRLAGYMLQKNEKGEENQFKKLVEIMPLKSHLLGLRIGLVVKSTQV